MENLKLKRNVLNRSTQMNRVKYNNLLNILPKKDEILFSQKTFLEIILGLIKETQSDYLTKRKSLGQKNDSSIIKEILSDLNNNLKEIKEEKKKKLKLIQLQKEQKQSSLKDIMNTTNIYQKRRLNSEIISMSVMNEDDSDDSSFDNIMTDQQDFKTKNFILENRIQELENRIIRIKYLIKFDKSPHRFVDHFTEIFIENKSNKQNITENLHGSLLNIRDIWKDIASKKNLQEMKLENIRTKIKNLKKESKKNPTKKIKYINTEDVIPEENLNTENNEDEKKVNEEPDNIDNIIKNIELDLDKSDEQKIKLGLKDMEKLLKLNMNINVNINLNKQYINNHFNNCEPNKLNENLNKKKKKQY